jgi:hypothetical protein
MVDEELYRMPPVSNRKSLIFSRFPPEQATAIAVACDSTVEAAGCVAVQEEGNIISFCRLFERR